MKRRRWLASLWALSFPLSSPLSWALPSASLLGACAAPQRHLGEAPWITGRMAVRVAASPERIASSFSAGFELRGNGERGELLLSTTLGTRVATASWAPGVALLQTAEGEQRYPDLDELSRRALGEALPLVALTDWLAGRPWPGAPVAALHPSTGSQAATPGFEQLGWRVDLSRYGEGAVTLDRDAAPAVQVRVRLDHPG